MKKNLLIASALLLTANCSLLISKSFAQYTMLYDFTTYANGIKPFGNLVYDGTAFYGMASAGGANTYGVIFKISADGATYTDIHDFDGTNGSYPEGSLYYDGTFFYGMTTSGGSIAGGAGTIFKIKPDGTGFVKMHDLASADGTSPYGSLISDGTYLYGMTNGGGASSYGTLFKIKTDGTGFLKLMDFTGSNGNSPYGTCLYDGTYLYGTTFYGEPAPIAFSGCGLIYKVKTDGTGYDTLKTFNGANGQIPRGTLISDGTYLYGTTSGGGVHMSGTIFKIKPDGTGYADLYDFAGYTVPDGAGPDGSLVSDGTFMYGMTVSGGDKSAGTLFKIKPDGTGYAVLVNFGNSNGSSPYGSPIIVGNSLYGLTEFGSSGTFFKYQLSATGVTDIREDATLNIFPNPFTNGFKISSHTKGEAILFDLTGKEILRQNISTGETTINTEKIAAGFYLLNYTTGNMTTTSSVVKF